ncbi:MAG TPA: hypothetical protein VM166_00065 [Gemmatimonadaceae bacterium]|nr:hypothetical protein [Gemmatimonadaceae bacterium]
MIQDDDYARAKETLIAHGTAIGALPPLGADKEWAALRHFVEDLGARGWTRNDVHDLTQDVLSHESERMSANAFNMLFDFIETLGYDCTPANIVRFPGDPEDEWELVLYARSRVGLQEG